MNETRHLVDMHCGGRIALHRVHGREPFGRPIIVAHGSISNADTMRTMSRFLADQGFDCWMLEWGGHGHSTPSYPKQNCEFPAFNDLPTAVDCVLEHTQHSQVFWLSHSGGGHLPLMYLGRHPEQQSRFAGLVTMGTQSTKAATRLRDKFGCTVLIGITTVLNRTPKVILPLGNEHEPTRLLAQWAGWNIRERWHGTDGLDYLQALSAMTIPTVIVAGARDRAAPIAGCREIYDAIGSDDKTWLVCSEANGFSRDFGHGELIRGPAAREELFPKLVDWIRDRDQY